MSTEQIQNMVASSNHAEKAACYLAIVVGLFTGLIMLTIRPLTPVFVIVILSFFIGILAGLGTYNAINAIIRGLRQ